MTSIPPLTDKRRPYAESIHPREPGSYTKKNFYCHSSDLSKSIPWYEAFFDCKARELGRKPPYEYVFSRGKDVMGPDAKWTFSLSKNHSSSNHIECAVYSLFDIHAIIARMENIGVNMSTSPDVQNILEDYPRGWRRYEDKPDTARYMGRRSHHTVACGFIDPSGNIVVVRLLVQEPIRDFGMVYL